MNLRSWLAIAAIFVSASSVTADEFFATKVEPLLKQHCLECHSNGQTIEGGLALDSKSGWLKGGASGPAIVPGKPEASLLITAISHAEKDLKMPPDKRLAPAEIAVLTEWVKLGAPDPRVLSPQPGKSDLSADDAWEAEFKKRLNWWSLRPMARVEPPQISDPVWLREPVDRFIRAALDQSQLSPAPPA